MTNNAKPTGFETDIDKAANAFEQLLTPQEEQEATVEEAAEEENKVEETEVEAQAETEIETQEETIEEENLEVEAENSETEENVEDEVEVDETDTDNEKYLVTINGEEIEVSEEELVNGYSRQQDYTRKTQEIAAQRKAVEQQLSDVEQERAIYKELLPKMETALKSGLQNEPDWETLKKADPVAYLSKKDEWEGKLKELEAVEQEKLRVQDEEKAQHNAYLQNLVEYGKAELLKAVPEWQDDKIAMKEKNAMMADAMSGYGFTQEELNQVFDHRLILLLRDGWKYRQTLKSVKKKPLQKAKSRVARAGTVNSTKASSPLKKAKQTVANSGKVSDAAKFFEQII